MIDKFANKYRFLSNFYKHRISIWGLTGDSLEHLYQAAKELDSFKSMSILHAKSPGKAKRMGTDTAERSDWYKFNIPLMGFLLVLKFSDPDLKRLLLDTGDQELFEGNTWHDNFWGGCSCKECSKLEKLNLHGKLLMQVREYYKSSDDEAEFFLNTGKLKDIPGISIFDIETKSISGCL